VSFNIRNSIRLILDHVLKVRFVISHILIPFGVMFLYFASSSHLLPAGVNKIFVTRSARYALPILILLYTPFFAAAALGRIKWQSLKIPGEELSAGDLMLLLLPLTPIAQYILNNDEILSPSDAILVFCFFAVLAMLLIIIVPALLRNSGSTRPVMYLGLAFAFLIANMASLSKQFAWYEWGSLYIQLPVFAGVWLSSWFLYRFKARDLMHIAIAVYFVANSIAQVYGREVILSSDPNQDNNMLIRLIGSRKPVVTPSIYLLVYDSYVVSETMSAYGIDNQAQEQYLEGQGFKIYPYTYSVGSFTMTSMSRVLNSSLNFYGPGRRGVSGDGVVQNLLEGFGYKTYGVFHSGYYLRGTIPGYDYSFPGYDSSSIIFIKAILEGAFRFDIEFDDVTQDQFVQEKESILSKLDEGPRFIYAHSKLPNHSQNSGACLPNEVELYAERLAKANIEMRHDIEMIMENDPSAIVIVAGDHGPYLTKNCVGTADGGYDISQISRLDIQDRYGTFLSIRWPSAEYEEYDDIKVLQDLFPAIFSYIFEDPGLLQAKVDAISHEVFVVSGAMIVDGVIVGGIHDGQALFTGGIE
jgi:hypothetical protein